MENGSEDFLLIREFATNSTIGESKLSDASNTVDRLNKSTALDSILAILIISAAIFPMTG